MSCNTGVMDDVMLALDGQEYVTQKRCILSEI